MSVSACWVVLGVLGLGLGPGLGGCGGTLAEEPAPLAMDQAPGWIAPEIEDRVVDFHGTCNWGRHAGAAERYRVPLRVPDHPGGTILVRYDARFDAADGDNVIGELPTGTRMLGDGPVYGGYGVGYAILVRGHTGRICRGYVSAAAVVVERAAGHPPHDRGQE